MKIRSGPSIDDDATHNHGDVAILTPSRPRREKRVDGLDYYRRYNGEVITRVDECLPRFRIGSPISDEP